MQTFTTAQNNTYKIEVLKDDTNNIALIVIHTIITGGMRDILYVELKKHFGKKTNLHFN